MPPRNYLTELELAHMLALSPSTLRQWRWLGKGPPWVKAGRTVRYPRPALQAWIDRRLVHTEMKF